MATLFLDTEFNGNGGQLISIALVPEKPTRPVFYEAMPCLDPVPWVAEHVIPVINKDPISEASLKRKLANYLNVIGQPTLIVADWPEDFMLFFDLLITGPGKMMKVPELLMDLRTDLKCQSEVPHNALADADALRRASRLAAGMSAGLDYHWCKVF